MRSFLEQYGTSIFTLVCIAILIAMAGPIGNVIKKNINIQIQNVDSVGTEEIEKTENLLTDGIKPSHLTIKNDLFYFNNETNGNMFNKIEFQLCNIKCEYINSIIDNYQLGNQSMSFTFNHPSGLYAIRYKTNGNLQDSYIFYSNIYLEQGQTYIFKINVLKISSDQWITTKPILIKAK